MKSVAILLFSAVFIAGITVPFYLIFSPKEKADVATAVKTRSSMPEQYPSVNDLRQNDGVGPNHSFCIDNAIKSTLRDPDSFKFISATLWTQDFASYGPKAWICQAEYCSKNAFGGYGLPEKAGIIFDADGCRVLNPLEKKSDAVAASERKTLMYAIKKIHDPVNNAP